MKLLLVLILATLLLQPFLQGPDLWWDEAVYLGLARSLGKGYYSLDPTLPVESFRPPLFPALLSLFSGNLMGMKMFVFLLSVIALLAVFLLARPYGQRVALLTILFVATASFFVFFTTKLLTEPLFITLLSLSLLTFTKRSPRNTAFAGVFVGLAFLTRYFATILIIGFTLALAIDLVRKKRSLKEVPAFFIPLLLVLIPWFLLGTAAYGSPLAGFFTNLDVYAVSIPQTFGEGLVQIGWVWTYLTPLILGFFYLFRKTLLNEHLPLTVLVLLTLGLFLAGPHKEARYLLSFLPIFALPAALTTNRLFTKQWRLVLTGAFVVLAGTTLWIGFSFAQEQNQASALIEASAYLKDISQPDDLILTQSYPFVYVLADRKAITYCGPLLQRDFNQCQDRILNHEFPLETLQQTLSTNTIAYILSYTSEPANPPEARAYFEKTFEQVAVFEQWGEEAVIIYRVL